MTPVQVRADNPGCGSCSLLEALSSLSVLTGVSADGADLGARADSGARAVPALLSVLEDVGVQVASVTVARPSLDDVYLRYAGRRFEVAA